MLAPRVGEIVRLLIEKGADPNTEDRMGRTALIRATMLGMTRMVQLLLESEGDPRIEDRHGNSALMIAVQNRHREIVALLRAKGA